MFNLDSKEHVDVSSGDLLGYRLIDETSIPGTFNGTNYGMVVKLQNGMIFEFNTYNYDYEYNPDVFVFATRFGGMVLYKLVIEGDDEVYDVTRIR